MRVPMTPSASKFSSSPACRFAAWISPVRLTSTMPSDVDSKICASRTRCVCVSS